MTNPPSRFETDLRADLSALADRAPAAPSGDALDRALRRRRYAARGRRLAITGSALSAAAATILLAAWLGTQFRSGGADRPDVSRAPAASVGPSVGPIDPTAPRERIQAALREAMSRCGVRGLAIVDKSPGQGISLAARGDAVRLDVLRGELEALLESFESVSVRIGPERMSYRLASSAPAGAFTTDPTR